MSNYFYYTNVNYASCISHNMPQLRALRRVCVSQRTAYERGEEIEDGFARAMGVPSECGPAIHCTRLHDAYNDARNLLRCCNDSGIPAHPEWHESMACIFKQLHDVFMLLAEEEAPNVCSSFYATHPCPELAPLSSDDFPEYVTTWGEAALWIEQLVCMVEEWNEVSC